jgi:hypothetical protein
MLEAFPKTDDRAALESAARRMVGLGRGGAKAGAAGDGQDQADEDAKASGQRPGTDASASPGSDPAGP